MRYVQCWLHQIKKNTTEHKKIKKAVHSGQGLSSSTTQWKIKHWHLRIINRNKKHLAHHSQWTTSMSFYLTRHLVNANQYTLYWCFSYKLKLCILCNISKGPNKIKQKNHRNTPYSNNKMKRLWPCFTMATLFLLRKGKPCTIWLEPYDFILFIFMRWDNSGKCL